MHAPANGFRFFTNSEMLVTHLLTRKQHGCKQYRFQKCLKCLKKNSLCKCLMRKETLWTHLLDVNRHLVCFRWETAECTFNSQLRCCTSNMFISLNNTLCGSKEHRNQIKLIFCITEMLQHWVVKCQIPTWHIKLSASKFNYTTSFSLPLSMLNLGSISLAHMSYTLGLQSNVASH